MPEDLLRDTIFGGSFSLPHLGTAMLGPDGVLLHVSDRFAALLGRTPQSLTGTSWFALVPPELEDAERQGFAALLTPGSPQSRPLGACLLDVHGERHSVAVMALRFESQGRVDIVALVHEKDDSSRIFRLAFDETQEGMALVGSDGKIKTVNSSMAAMMGCCVAELLGTPIFEIDQGIIPSKWENLWHHVRNAKLRNTFDTVYRRKDGTEFPVEVSSTFVSLGAEGYIFATARDITGRRDREKERDLAVRRLREILKELPTAVYVTRLDDGTFLHANPVIGQKLGVEPEALIGRSIEEFYVSQSERKAMIRRLRRDGKVEGFDVHLKTDAGKQFWARASITLFTFMGEEAALSSLYDVSEEIQAQNDLIQIQDNLKRSEERYALAMEASREGIYDLDLASSVLYVSPRVEAIFGFPPHGLRTAADWLSRLHPDDRVAYQRTAIEHFKGIRPSIDAEYRITDYFGDTRWIRERSVCRRRDDGRAVRLVGSVGDITELKATRRALEEVHAQLELRVEERTKMLKLTTEALAQREERLNGIMNTVPDGIITIDQNGIIETANPAIERIFGWSLKELAGQNITMLMPDSYRARHSQSMEKHAISGERSERIISIEVEGLRKNGTVFPVEISVSPLWLPEQVLYTGLVRDISQRKESEEALRKSEQRYRSIFEQAVEGIFQTTPDGQYLDASPALAKLYGYDSPEELMHSVTDISVQVYLNSHDRDTFKRIMAEKGEVRGFEYQVIRRDGTPLWVSENCRAVRNAKGKILYYEGTVEDITERKRAESDLAEKSALLEATFENITQAVAIFDSDLRLLVCNNLYGRILDLPKRLQAVGAPLSLILRHMADRGDAVSIDDPDWRLAQGKEVQASKVERPMTDGTVVQVMAKRIADGRVLVSYNDVTDLKRREAALRLSEERYALAAQGANDGLWDWDLKSNRVYYSPRWKSMLGCRDDEIPPVPDSWFERVHHDDIDALHAAFDAHLKGNASDVEMEYRIRHADGSYRWVLTRGVSVVDQKSSQPTRIAGSQTDITQRKRTEQQLLHDAFHDGLTGLPNRALFVDRLSQALTRYKRDSSRFFAVMFLDLDRFKYVNDSLGHSAGDSLIIAVAKRLDASRRASDTVARFGGDEFAILIEDMISADRVADIAERFRSAVGKPINLAGQEIYPTASIGIAFANVDYERPEDMLVDADLAMYHAKSVGRDRFESFQPEMRAHSATQLEMGADLRRAFERNEMVLFYQPIVDLRSGGLAGFEGLIRWRHPQRGLVPPGDFIPLAEETGLIIPLGWWVFEQASLKMEAWNRERPLSDKIFVSLNVSARQFKEEGLIDRIEAFLEKNAIQAESLKLEITESLLMDNPEVAAEWLDRLKALDLSLSIDDFGTGYSSLSYLHRFPFDTLKIDRSFVSTMQAKRENMEIVRAIVSLAQALNMKVVAEGVETQAELEILRGLGCDYAQGYYFSRPVPEADAEGLLRRRPIW
jgi:diguanylate cyclase (GGDEF)-like protein/PAS domain S-box-containing protein